MNTKLRDKFLFNNSNDTIDFFTFVSE